MSGIRFSACGAFGWRSSIQRCFETQLRAILRASAAGNISVMFPLVSTLLELKHAKMVLREAMEDLEEEGAEFDRKIKVGMMIEVPSAVIMMDHFADEVDFFSIGTNDLIQYVLAVDRSNTDVAGLYTGSDPAVLRLLDMAIRTAEREESADQPVRADVRQSRSTRCCCWGWDCGRFSVTPAAIPEIKQVCRRVSMEHVQEAWRSGRWKWKARATCGRI